MGGSGGIDSGGTNESTSVRARTRGSGRHGGHERGCGGSGGCVVVDVIS